MKAAVQIFLSYAREDAEKVENLYQKLSDAGFKPWMDTSDILAGEKWELAIRQAIRNSDFFLVCLSANSVKKRGWVQKEMKQALDIWQEKLDSDIYLIPVRLEDCEVPESLRDVQWVELFEKDGWTRLVKAIQIGMERRGEVIKPQKSMPSSESYADREKSSSGMKMAAPETGPEQVQLPKAQVVSASESREEMGTEQIEQRILEALHEADLTCPEGLTEQELSTRLGFSVNVLYGYLLRLEKEGYVKSEELAKGIGGIPHGIRLWCITREGAQTQREAKRPAQVGDVRVGDGSMVFISSQVMDGDFSVGREKKVDAYGADIGSAEGVDEREHLQTLLKTHRRNLQKLEIQQADYGALDVPLRLLNQIEAEKQKIAEIEAKLAELARQAGE